MSTPSLLCVPYRLKAGTLYSQIPDSGLGDFVVTRSASNSATRVNAAGFIETVADNVPRLDYPLGGITAGCPALLVEPSAQNLAVQSEDFTLSANWNTSTAGRTLVTGNVTATLDPYGGNVADLLSDDNTASSTHRMYTAGNISITSGTTYSTSFFVKANTTPWFEIRLMQSGEGDAGIAGTVFNLTSGTITSGSGTIQNYGNGWYRCTNIGTSNFTGNGRIFFYVYNSSGTKSYNGTSSNSLYIFGAQLEVGSVPTSYIPTTTAAITRGAETVSKTGVSSLIGQTQGTIYCEFAYFGRPIDRSSPLYLRQASLRGMSINSDSINTGIVFGSRNDGGSTFITLVPGALQLGTYYKIAIGYDAGNTPAGGQQANGVVAYVNGVQVATGTLRVPDAVGLSEFRMYSANSGNDSEIPNIRIRAHAIYPTRLPNTGPISLQSLTQ